MKADRKVYFAVILWGTFGLTLFRFIGFLWYESKSSS